MGKYRQELGIVVLGQVRESQQGLRILVLIGQMGRRRRGGREQDQVAIGEYRDSWPNGQVRRNVSIRNSTEGEPNARRNECDLLNPR